jgi:hypothetical protein
MKQRQLGTGPLREGLHGIRGSLTPIRKVDGE